MFGGRERKGMIKGKINKKSHMGWYMSGMGKKGCQPINILSYFVG